MLVRIALGAFCATTLVTSGLSPAMAHDDDDDLGELKVTVCKKVKDNDNHEGSTSRDKDEEFDFEAWTDEDRKSFSLEDDECKKFKLDFDNNKFWLKEYEVEKYDVDFRVSGDDDWTDEDDDQVKVWFDEDGDEPCLSVKVTNDKHDDDKHDDDEDDDDEDDDDEDDGDVEA